MPATNIQVTGVNAAALQQLVRTTKPIGSGDLAREGDSGWSNIKHLSKLITDLFSQMNTRTAPLAGNDDPNGVVPGYQGEFYYRRTTTQWYCNVSVQGYGTQWLPFPG